jgi:hypothetical protein
MACFESGTVVEMAAREAVTLQNVRGATVRVTRGTVWLTQQDDGKDVILRVGDNWLVERDGATVLESQEGDALVCVVGRQLDEVPGARRPARRQARWHERVAAVLTATTRRTAPYF